MTGWEILFTAYMTKRWLHSYDVTPTLIRHLQFGGNGFGFEFSLGVIN